MLGIATKFYSIYLKKCNPYESKTLKEAKEEFNKTKNQQL